jgi:hypothetical protein
VVLRADEVSDELWTLLAPVVTKLLQITSLDTYLAVTETVQAVRNDAPVAEA